MALSTAPRELGTRLSRTPRPTNQRAGSSAEGLTLVELMVTMVVASLVAASTFVFFAGQRRIYDTQMKVLNIQQNLWAAMEAVSRNVRVNGMGMNRCVRPDTDGAGALVGDPPPVGATRPLTGLRAFRQNINRVIRLPPLWIQNGAAGAPDALEVAYGSRTFGNDIDSDLAATVDDATDRADVPVGFIETFRGPTAAGAVDGEFFVLLDRAAFFAPARMGAGSEGDAGCTLFQITGLAGGLVHAPEPAPGSSWNPAGNPNNAPEGALVPFAYTATDMTNASRQFGIRNLGNLVWLRFFIDDGGGPPAVPRLMIQNLANPAIPAQILAEGIEDMQIAYGCDTAPAAVAPALPGDGVITEGSPPSTTDEWWLNVAGDVPTPACNRPQAVRITLIARSPAPDTSIANPAANIKPAVEDGAAGAPDLFRHRVITTTVFPRNQ